MNFRFRKYGRAGAVLLGLLAAACHRAPLFNTPATATLRPVEAAEPDPPITPGVSETLAQARKATISGIAYNISLNIPAQKTEPIEVDEQVSFILKDNSHPVQLDFKAPADNLHSLTVNGKTLPINHHDEHLVPPVRAGCRPCSTIWWA